MQERQALFYSKEFLEDFIKKYLNNTDKDFRLGENPNFAAIKFVSNQRIENAIITARGFLFLDDSNEFWEKYGK